MTQDEEFALASTIAEQYYLEDRSMVQIAEGLGITRFQVARLLQLARKSGIVKIEINSRVGVHDELSAKVASALGIDRAVVLSGTSESPRDDIARALAEVVSAVVQPGAIVGLTWSRTLLAMVHELKSLPYCTLVQLAGHTSTGVSGPGSVEIIRRAAEVSGGEAYPIYAPLLAPDAYVAQALRQQPDTVTAFEFYRKLDLAVISVGAWREGSSSIYEAVTPAERDSATKNHAVGEISGRLFDATGKSVSGFLNERTIGISLEEITRVPNVIASSYGADRAEAIIAAARGSLFRTLVIDRGLALAILARFDDADALLARP